MGNAIYKQGIAIRCRFANLLRAQIAVRSHSVFDCNRLPKGFTQPLGECSGDKVDGAGGRERYDYLYRF
jgi:hypothetical protein